MAWIWLLSIPPVLIAAPLVTIRQGFISADRIPRESPASCREQDRKGLAVQRFEFPDYKQ
jgi:hypothetical protein